MCSFNVQVKARNEELEIQVATLQSEKVDLSSKLEACLDQLDFCTGACEQLKLEASTKWRVEERNDWKALVDSVQKDRDDQSEENSILSESVAELEAELKALREGVIDPNAVPLPPHQPAQSPSIPDSPMSPRSTSNLRKELQEACLRLENEKAIVSAERREAARLRQELSARRDREKWQHSAGLFVKFAQLTRLWHTPKARALGSSPVNV